MPDCRHLLGVYYCLEVDQETSLDMGKVAFYTRPALAITMCALCNHVFDAVSTATPPIKENLLGPLTTNDGSASKEYRA